MASLGDFFNPIRSTKDFFFLSAGSPEPPAAFPLLLDMVSEDGVFVLASLQQPLNGHEV